MNIHHFLDHQYGNDGPEVLQAYVRGDVSLENRAGPFHETPLHVATRRRRLEAVTLLLDAGANIDATTSGGKTAYAHAARRGFDEIARLLQDRGADTSLNDADVLAVAFAHGDLEEASRILKANPTLAHTGNPEEDRLLADVAGRNAARAVVLLIEAGANLSAPGLDSGTPLHQAAWFGQPVNAGHLLAAGAPVHVFDAVHDSSPLGWAVHGSRYSGGAVERQTHYVILTQMLLEAGASLSRPGETENEASRQRFLHEASPAVRAVLEAH